MHTGIRKPYFIVGVIALFLAFAELYLCVNQPNKMKGYSSHGTTIGYEITEVAEGGPADIAGMCTGDVIVSINDINMAEFWLMYVKGKSFDTSYQYAPYLFSRGESYRCSMLDGSVKTFTIPEHSSFFHKLGIMNRDDSINFITGILFIILGFIISLLSTGTDGISDFIWFMYAVGICIINSYEVIYNTVFYSKLNVVLYNLSCAGIAFALLRIIGYFYSILRKEKSVKYIRMISCIPFIIICIELVLMLSGATSFWGPFGLETPNLFGSVALVIALLYSFFMFFRLLAHIPRQSSLSLRFFLIGICFGALPTLAIVLIRTITASYLASFNETLITILPLLSIPLSVLCSVFQSIKPEYDQISARTMAGVGTAIVLVLISLGLSSGYSTMLTLMCLSPFVFLIIEKPLTAFLYPKLTYVQRDLDSLEKQVFLCETEDAVFDVISGWLFANLNARYVVFSKFSDSDGFVSAETVYAKAQEEQYDMTAVSSMIDDRINGKKSGLFSHQGRGCSCPLYQSHEIAGYIFIGARSRYDMFSGMEMRLLPPVARILMEALTMMRLKKQGKYLSDMQNQIVFSFADMIESRDGSTGLHVKRTSQIVELLSKRLMEKGTYGEMINPLEYEMIALAAPLHDIGKIKIPDAILSKPGKLTDEEFSTIKTHPVEGEKIIRKTMAKIEDERYLAIARDMALYHHEKWNGTGYPMGLKGAEIPVCARIMAVADVFDALCSARCYKKAFSIDEAYAIFEDSSGTHFEPVLVEILKELRSELEQIYQN